MVSYKGRVGIMQRVLPHYRAPFFDLFANQCEGGLSVFAGAPRPAEAIPQAEKLTVANRTHAHNIHIFGGPLYLCWQGGLTRWLEEWNPDVLIVEANPRYVSTGAAVHWMKQRQRPVIGWGLGSPTPRGGLACLRMKRRKRFLDQFDALIAYSSWGAAEYSKLGLHKPVRVAPNAVEPKPVEQPHPRSAEFAGKPVVLYVGRLQARKRLDVLIRICANLPSKFQPRLVLVGDGPEREALEAVAREVSPTTEFRGALFGNDLARAYAEADIFVLPGTGGLAVQQAMAHGLPIIAAEGDGSQQDMVTLLNGWLLKPQNDASLRTALVEALSDAPRLRRMGAESFRLVQEKFNIDMMAEAFIDIIHEVTK